MAPLPERRLQLQEVGFTLEATLDEHQHALTASLAARHSCGPMDTTWARTREYLEAWDCWSTAVRIRAHQEDPR